MEKITDHKKDIRAQGLVEYILIISLLAISSILALNLTGVTVRDIYESIFNVFGNQERVLLADDFQDLNNWKAVFGPNKWKSRRGVVID